MHYESFLFLAASEHCSENTWTHQWVTINEAASNGNYEVACEGYVHGLIAQKGPSHHKTSMELVEFSRLV